MKRLNKNMHGDDPAYYALPESRELAAQFLLLYEMSLPYGLDLNNQINVDKSATRFTVTLDNISATEVRALVESGQAWLEENGPPESQSVGSGPLVMFSYISGINIRSMLIGSTLALVLISALMVLALRSVRLGLLSFIPNLIPGAIAFGIWGLASGVVNLGLSIVIGMTLGIVVDDSIHLMTKVSSREAGDAAGPGRRRSTCVFDRGKGAHGHVRDSCDRVRYSLDVGLRHELRYGKDDRDHDHVGPGRGLPVLAPVAHGR